MCINIGQKSINENVNPLTSMIINIFSSINCFFYCNYIFPSKNIMDSFKELNWASYVLGVAIFGLEIGFLLVYRSGWNINIAALFANVVTTVNINIFRYYIFLNNNYLLPM